MTAADFGPAALTPPLDLSRPSPNPPKSSKPSARRRTAIHEAGHAVVACRLDLECCSVTIVPDYDEGEAGHTIVPDPWYIYGRWDERGKYREISTVMHGRIISNMAGAEAEVEFFGICTGGDSFDRREIAFMMADLYDGADDATWQRREARLRAMARMLVRLHRTAFERLAGELLKRRTLNREDLETIVFGATSRPDEDLRPNQLATERTSETRDRVGIGP